MVFNGAQFHLLVNHLPVIGFLIVIPILFFAIRMQSIDVKRVVLIVTTFVGFSSLGSYYTGEPAEEVIENLAGVDETFIHEHEEAAELATILAVLTAVVAGGAFALQMRRPETLKYSMPFVLLLSLGTAGAMGNAAHEGGKVRHPEIRDNAQIPTDASDTIEDDEIEGD